MDSPENHHAFQEAARLQHAANTLCDIRSAIAPVIFGHIATRSNYHSWALAGTVATLHATDKLDGLLAKKRAESLEHIPEDQHKALLPRNLLEAIKIGGRKDDKADKALTHAIFVGISAREFQNGNTTFASIVGATDGGMLLRDFSIGIIRDKAQKRGIKPDARDLGKWKQALLATTSILAVTPLAAPPSKEKSWNANRTIVAAGMIGGLLLSGISAVDQIRSINKSQNY
jgi:phosphatidylglycerophosphate synthase